MQLVLLSMLAAIQPTAVLTAPKPKNFGPYRYILPAMPGQIRARAVDVRLGVELLIDPQGTPTNCRVVSAGGSPPMANWLCDNMRQLSRFEPARDAGGAASYSYYTYWHTFGFRNAAIHTTAIPDALVRDDEITASASDRVAQLVLLVDQAGKVDRCEVVKGSGASKLDESACFLVKKEGFYLTKNEAGEPVPTIRMFSVGYEKRH